MRWSGLSGVPLLSVVVRVVVALAWRVWGSRTGPVPARLSAMRAGRLGQGVRETLDDGGSLFIGDREGRQKAYDAGVAAAELDDESTAEAFALHGGGEFGRGRMWAHVGCGRPVRVLDGAYVDQLDADHQAAASHVPDAGVFGGEALELAHHAGTQEGGAFGETVLPDIGEGRGAGGHGELVPAERAGVGPGLPHVEVVAIDDDGQGRLPPIALERTMTSGTTPLCSTAQKAPVLPTPVWTSSAISGMERAAVSSRIRRIQASGAGITPPSPGRVRGSCRRGAAPPTWDRR